MDLNLSSLLLHDFKYPEINSNFYTKCLKKDCHCCFFANSESFILLKNYYYFSFNSRSSCDSISCVYIITCKLCNIYYIGQTNNLKNRIYSHLNDILKFKPFVKRNSCVSIHFNLKHHNFLNHFSFFILENNIETDQKRLRIETSTIYFFKKLEIKILNELIPSYIKD